ncbi:MAG: aminoacetone oxidase family FAD-binding enzyme, partial [Saprospiraceae bacterium]|nr:aminoacetone oxidase family FAD-binding enzyme [Saprospiraceae bacterium]
ECLPTTDNSSNDCGLSLQNAHKKGVKILKGYRVEDITVTDGLFEVKTNVETMIAEKLVVASGNSTGIWSILGRLGHRIVSPVPSLFTFNIKDTRLENLAGVSLPEVEIKVVESKLVSTGALLITHWGLSGPSILRLSAWGARAFFDNKYQFEISVNWTGFEKIDSVKDALNDCKSIHSKKMIANTPKYNVPSRLWEKLVEAASIPTDIRWADMSKIQLQKLAEQLTQSLFSVVGKSTFKEEFVTAGGVDLAEINFKTFESKLIPNLFFAGEVLNIDAITGGFNFQAAWTGGWIVGNTVAEK